MPTPAEVKAIGPNDSALQAMSDATLQIYIDVASCLVALSPFCTAACGEKARTFMAAHLATLSIRAAGGVAGPVTQESVGDLSRSYASALTDSGELGLTGYGQVVLALQRTLIVTPMVV